MDDLWDLPEQDDGTAAWLREVDRDWGFVRSADTRPSASRSVLPCESCGRGVAVDRIRPGTTIAIFRCDACGGYATHRRGR